jgi:hypothetical protein
MTSFPQGRNFLKRAGLIAPLLSAGLIWSGNGSAQAASIVFNAEGRPAGTASLGLPPVVAPTGQVAPIQLNMVGNTFAGASVTPPGRKFDFRGLTTTGGTGLFSGVSGIQWIGTANSGVLRSDYSAPSPGTCTSANISAGGTCDWSDMDVKLRPFYFLGDASCSICGPTNQVSLVNLIGSGNRTVSGATSPFLITDTVETSFATISFGSDLSAPQAKVRFVASNSYPIGGVRGPDFVSSGSLYFEEHQVPAVPGPLPILGGSVAFGFSRKIRKRLGITKQNS